ncbi:phosphate acetyltransferase, partial [Escherichia coli]|nr:phosphate acetyltransferase [Escherichia coli]
KHEFADDTVLEAVNTAIERGIADLADFVLLNHLETAAETLASLRNRLNAFEHMTDEAGRAMRNEAESHASTLERKKWQPSS